VRIGAEFTAEQAALASQSDIAGNILVLPRLEPELVAAAYRRSALTLFPSEREGFGLPLPSRWHADAVVASDIQYSGRWVATPLNTALWKISMFGPIA